MHYPYRIQNGSTYLIQYTNAEGLTSERIITVTEQWFEYSSEYIKAYCKKRQELRTFRVDRIKTICKLPEPADMLKPATSNISHLETRGGSIRSERCKVVKRQKSSAPGLLLLFGIVLILWLWRMTPSSSTSAPELRVPAKPAVEKTIPVKTAEWEHAVMLRSNRYRNATGFGSTRLLDIYKSADTNYDNILSWQEIDRFQQTINREFSYEYNDAALNPEEFLISGGGDCEDWSLFTCGMLRFWGYTSYVGVIDGGNGTGLHAIALFYKKTPPANKSFRYYKLDTSRRFSEVTIPPGCYLPIDYNHAGSFSNASRPDSPLRYVYIPEEIYGRQM